VHPTPAGYFDAAAGLPLHPVAAEALQAATADGWADPGRLTRPGRLSATLLDAARASLADSLGVQPDEVSFVPSGSHALHLAVLGTLAGNSRAGRRLVHSAVEHSAVLKAAQWHAERGGDVEVVGVDGHGRVAAADFAGAARRTGTAAAVLQAANHEVGTTQPVAEVAAALAGTGVPLVVDAAQQLVFGAAPSGAQVFTGDARLWGGPAGVGVLVVRRGTRWRSPFPADEAEFGRSPGVPAVAAILAAAASLRAVHADRDEAAVRLADLIELLRSRIEALVPDSVVLGHPQLRLPHLLTFSNLYLDGEALLTALDRRGFAVSSGSSCTSDTLTPSHVLVAMGALTSGNVRVSLHRGTTPGEVERFLQVLPEVVAEVRAQLPDGTPDPSATAATTTAETFDAAVQLDSRGRRCPLPILDMARALPRLQVGAVLTVLADDPAAASDIAAWCRMQGQELVDSSPYEQASAYRVRRLR
jgi:cysteine desulfurase